MLYIHGGLNGEEDVAKRIIAFRDVCLANEIYPLHIMWESDWFNTTRTSSRISSLQLMNGRAAHFWTICARRRIVCLS